MDVVEYLLDGLEAALELERDLGVRTLEVDRSLLAAPANGAASIPRAAPVPSAVPVPRAAPAPASRVAPASGVSATKYDFIFLHDRPLSPGGIEMMAKIITALGRTAETAPVVIEPPVPASKVAVALGVPALHKFFPGLRGSPGQWLKSADGRDVLVSNSPADILRYGTVTPAVKKIKVDMWRNLKTVLQRIAQ